MKKTIFTLIGILVGLFILLSFLTSNSEYKAEKKFWKISKKFSKLKQNEKTVSMDQLDSAISQVKDFLREFPDSPMEPYAHLLVGDIYVAKKNYSTARQKYEQIIQIYGDQPQIVESAIVRTINSHFEEEGKDDTTLTIEQEVFQKRTKGVFGEKESNSIIKIMDTLNKEQDVNLLLRTYQRAIKDFPKTDLGLQAPILIAKLYFDDGKIAQSENALNYAINYYQEFIKDEKNPTIRLKAQELLVSCYLIQNNFSPALDVLGQILLQHHDADNLTDQGRLQIAELINDLSKRTKEFERSMAIYRQFVQKYPRHSFKNTIENKLNELSVLKTIGR